MVLSYYIIRRPYEFTWKVVHLFRRRQRVILHCEDAIDAVLFRYVQKHLPPIPIVAKKNKVRDKLKSMNIKVSRGPYFPDAVIMFRNSAWKFPVKQIVKIGFVHGAYSFKRFPKAYYYNMFDVFFMTSDADVERAKKHGVTTAKAIGYVKSDSLFDGSMAPDKMRAFADQLGLDPAKKTVLFSATWDGSGMSAIEKWYNRLEELTPRYNILVTVHSWTSDTYIEALQRNNSIFFIREFELLRYIKLTDVCISDTTSLIAEFCLLNKPIITFRVPKTARTMPDVLKIIEAVSCRIDNFEEIAPAIERALNCPDEFKNQRDEVVRTLVNPLDGKAGWRAAQEIVKLVPQLHLVNDPLS